MRWTDRHGKLQERVIEISESDIRKLAQQHVPKDFAEDNSMSWIESDPDHRDERGIPLVARLVYRRASEMQEEEAK